MHIIFLASLFIILSPNLILAGSDTHWLEKVNGYNLNIVTIDLKSGNYEVGVSTGNDKVAESESFHSQIKRNNAVIASNGNFFSSYSPQGKRDFYGLLMKKGTRYLYAHHGAFGFTVDNQVEFRPFHDGVSDEPLFPETVIDVVSGDPALVHNGENIMGQYPTTRNDLDKRNTRTAMAFTKDQKLLLVTGKSISIRAMADCLVSLGAESGVNLDGGASSALYYRGKTITPPGWNLNAVFYLKEKQVPDTIEEEKPIRIKINGKVVESDVDPFLENNRTLVPIRVISENLGIDVEWIGERKEVILRGENNFKMTLKIDEKTYKVNGQNKIMDTEAKIKNVRTMVPIRVIAKSFNKDVQWDNNNRTVIIENK